MVGVVRIVGADIYRRVHGVVVFEALTWGAFRTVEIHGAAGGDRRWIPIIGVDAVGCGDDEW